MIMFMPTYLLDKFGWYTDKLGICLYVRWPLTIDKLQLLNDMIKENNTITIFHGVEQLVVVDDTTASEGDKSSDDNIDEPSDGTKDEGQSNDENRMPINQSQRSENDPAESSPKHESNEGGSPFSGGGATSDLGNLGEGSSFPRIGAGVAGQASNTSVNNGEGGDDVGLSRPEEIDSTQPMNENWRLLRSFCEFFCCCPKNSRHGLHVPSSAGDNPTAQFIETMRTSLPPILSNTPNETVIFSIMSPDSSNEKADAAGIHASTEESDIHSNSMQNIMNHNTSSAGDQPIAQYNERMTASLTPILSNTPNETVISSITSPDSSSERAADAEIYALTGESGTHSNSMQNIVNHNRDTNASHSINANGCVNHNPNYTIINNCPQGASVSEMPKAPKFIVTVCTVSTAKLEDRGQEFTIDFTLKIATTKWSHKFELSKIALSGGKQHLIKNRRYFFKNFRIEIVPCNDRISCTDAEPISKITNHWDIAQTGDSRGIIWCHRVDQPVMKARILRHQIETHMAEYKWGCFKTEPTEYF
ncbi:hypothetical protein BC938DRAFT_480111, partial [Jimgerdemannia flammicorona]